jgi:hypothetical protein
MGANL